MAGNKASTTSNEDVLGLVGSGHWLRPFQSQELWALAGTQCGFIPHHRFFSLPQSLVIFLKFQFDLLQVVPEFLNSLVDCSP